MKKLFSYLLISSMVVLSSCTNYDDQFDDLNTQINTLKSQIEGFSSLSSGLTALQGTVGSLQTAIANIPVTPATDVSGLEASLAALADTVAELKASLADAASADAVAALQADLIKAQADLTELLASNNVYSENLVIDSEADLTFAMNLGDKLSIVNGNVTFIVDETMTIANVQSVASKFVTITGDLHYFAKTSSVDAINFDALTGVNDLIFAQAGNYNLGSLVSAADISLGSNYTTDVNVVDLGALATVTSLNTETVSASGQTVSATSSGANTLSFNRATNIHLTSLTYYTPGDLTLEGARDFTLMIDALTSLDDEGEEVGLDLTVDGAAELNNDGLVTGTVITTNVPVVTLKNLQTANGATVGNAETLILGAVVGDLTVSGNDLETATITTILDPEDEDDEIAGDITLSATSLVSVTIDGVSDAISFSGASDLETAIIKGTASSILFKDNASLTSIDLTAAVTGAVTVENADDLVSLVLAHTVAAGEDETNGSLIITNNAKLTSVVADSVDNLGTLTITGNDDLSSVSFAALADVGSDADGADVTIGGALAANKNNLSAQKIEDLEDTVVTTDEGKITTDSGIDGLKAYLEAAIAAEGTVYVAFDTVDLHIADDTNNTETVNITSGDKLVVVDFSAGTTTTVADVRETKSFVIDVVGRNSLLAADALDATTDALTIGVLGATKTFAASTTLVTVSDLVAAINADTTFGSDVTITAAQDAYAKSYNKINYTDAAGAAETVGSGAGTVTWTYGTASGTITLASGDASAALATKLAAALVATVSGYSTDADTVSGTVIVSKTVTPAHTAEYVGPITFGSSEKFGFTINASTTASFGGASTALAGLASDYNLTVSKTNVNGLRITIKNNSTTVALATAGDASVSVAATDNTLVSGAAVALVSGTNFRGTTLAIPFTDVVVGSSTTTGDSDVDYTSWL